MIIKTVKQKGGNYSGTAGTQFLEMYRRIDRVI